MKEHEESAKEAYDLVLKMLVERMESMNVTVGRLSTLTGISRQVLGRYFKKEAQITFMKHLKICSALRVNPYWVPQELDNDQIEHLRRGGIK